ncbi:hypothetical protein HDIA_1550 [Hartmannibacter diazotrophicus]|uniref:Uncharacterized protein n=1 Tax=Hartmannibacter diazotrophicus TaxID=1482074 RepID=A0A2C9D5S0_9HYPH|nr:hypothetical protein [Hartmannibacter diazotrophicus]SON55091.1 hypothetical protein HDIA_1550 [Hartmannibacter diazotrophicus]
MSSLPKPSDPAATPGGTHSIVLIGALGTIVYMLGFAAPASGLLELTVTPMVAALAPYGYLGIDLLFIALGIWLSRMGRDAGTRAGFALAIADAALLPILLTVALASAIGLLLALTTPASFAVVERTFSFGFGADFRDALVTTLLVIVIGSGRGFASRIFDAGVIWLALSTADRLLNLSLGLETLLATHHAAAVIFGLLLERLWCRRADEGEQALFLLSAIAVTANAVMQAHDIGQIYGVEPRSDVLLVLMPALLLLIFAIPHFSRVLAFAQGWSLAGLEGLLLVSGPGITALAVTRLELPAGPTILLGLVVAFAGGKLIGTLADLIHDGIVRRLSGHS